MRTLCLAHVSTTLFNAAVAFIIMRRLVNDAAVRSSRIIDDELGESDHIFARDHARMAEHNRELANLCMTLIIMLAAINQLVGVILAPRAIYDAPANGAAGGTSGGTADSNQMNANVSADTCAFKIIVNIITHGYGALFVVPAAAVLSCAVFAVFSQCIQN